MAPMRTADTVDGGADKVSNGINEQDDNVKSVNQPVEGSQFQVVHQVFRHRAADPQQVPLLAFPKNSHIDFEYFNGKDLDRFTDRAAWSYNALNLRVVSIFSDQEFSSKQSHSRTKDSY